MRISYDQTVDAVYVELSASEVARTVEIDPGTMVDLDRFGALVGIEVLSPARPWPLEAILERFSVDDMASSQLRAMFAADDAAKPWPFASQQAKLVAC